MTDFDIEEIKANFTFNRIHKRFMVLFDSSDMRYVWKKVRSLWKKEKKIKLPKRFKKYPEIWQELNIWVEEKVTEYVENGGEDINYLNKADLKERGWDEKILKLLYPKPDKAVYLGRGRYAYYYNANKLSDLEDSEEFIEHTYLKLERKRKREAKKAQKDNMFSGFGGEFVR